MDAQQFLAEFGHIANAPNGIDRIRDLILDLAIQGRLIFSNENQEATAGLLAEISEWRVYQQQSKKGRRSKVETPISDIEKPFAIPKHWIWVRNSDLFSLAKGKNPKDLREKGKYPYLDIEALDRGNVQRYTDDEQAPRTTQTDILVVCDGSRSGLVLDGKDGVIGSTLARIDTFPAIQPFVKLLFLHSYRRINAEKKGAAIPHLDTAKLLISPCGLPPLRDQISIITKVKELMTLCDKLEAKQQARRKLQNKLRQSALQAVASSQSPHELQTTWTRLAENFGQLFNAPEDIADLRKMASELAIRGALNVLSEATDTSTVDVYLAELAKRKSGKRFAKSIQMDEDIPLPKGWRWVLLEDLLSNSESGWSPKCEAEPRRDGEWGVLKVSAVTWGAFNPNENKRLPLSLEAKPDCEVKPGDFMLSRANTADLVARSVIAPDDCPEKLLISDKIVRLNFLDDALKSWVNLVNNSDLARTYYKERATGTSDSMRNVSRQVIHELPIPLPSLKVQERVLLALSRLLRYCDVLEQQAASRMKLSAQFSTSVISSLSGITIKQEEEPMKAPQTELISTLRLGVPPSIKAQAPLATILARQHGEMSAKDLWLRFGGEIDAFYAQLKTEVAQGWIVEPAPAEMREKPFDAVSA